MAIDKFLRFFFLCVKKCVKNKQIKKNVIVIFILEGDPLSGGAVAFLLKVEEVLISVIFTCVYFQISH